MFSSSSSSNNTGSTFSSGKCIATLIPENRRKSGMVNYYDREGTDLSIDFSNHSDIASGVYTFSQDVYDGRNGEYGNLKRYSRRIGSALGVHHFLILDIPGYWVVYEWMDDSYAHCCRCKTIKGKNGFCFNFGEYKMSEVWDAVKKATLGKKYSKEYNCNIWCDKVMSYLGWNCDTHWNCVCVTNSDHPAWIEDSCNIF